MHLLVDWENVQPKGDELKTLVPEGTDVWLFHGPHQPVDHGASAGLRVEQVTLVPRTGAGRNALDFQLVYYVGYISARQPEGRFVVVSNDQGYEPMLEHASENWGLMRSGVGSQSTNTARRIRRSDSTEVRYLAAAAASASVVTGSHPAVEATVKPTQKL